MLRVALARCLVVLHALANQIARVEVDQAGLLIQLDQLIVLQDLDRWVVKLHWLLILVLFEVDGLSPDQQLLILLILMLLDQLALLVDVFLLLKLLPI